MRRSLVLCPLAIETKAFKRFGKARVLQIGCGAAAVERAFHQIVANDPPNFVVLFGLAGALDPAFERGSEFVASDVSTNSDPNAAVMEAPALSARCSPTPARARIIECATAVRTPMEKAALAARTGAQLVDMESYTFARCAQSMGIPWAIVRGVSDSASDTLAPEVPSFIDAHGNTRHLCVLRALLRRPSLFGELRSMRSASNKALQNGAFLADALCCAMESAS